MLWVCMTTPALKGQTYRLLHQAVCLNITEGFEASFYPTLGGWPLTNLLRQKYIIHKAVFWKSKSVCPGFPHTMLLNWGEFLPWFETITSFYWGPHLLEMQCPPKVANARIIINNNNNNRHVYRFTFGYHFSAPHQTKHILRCVDSVCVSSSLSVLRTEYLHLHLNLCIRIPQSTPQSNSYLPPPMSSFLLG